MIRITIGKKHPITIEVDDWGDVDVGLGEGHDEDEDRIEVVQPLPPLPKYKLVEVDEDDEYEAEGLFDEPESNGVAISEEQAALHDELLNVGKGSLQTLVEAWADGFCAPLDEKGHSTVEQPNRAQILQKIMAKSGRSIMAYIEHCGTGNAEQRGLRAAVRSVLPPSSVILPDGLTHDQFTDEIAGNIVQLASIYVPPLADTIEYTHVDSRG